MPVICVQSLPRSVRGGHPSDCTTAIQEQAPTYEAAAVNSVITFCRTDLSPWEASASSSFQAFISLSSQPERPDMFVRWAAGRPANQGREGRSLPSTVRGSRKRDRRRPGARRRPDTAVATHQPTSQQPASQPAASPVSQPPRQPASHHPASPRKPRCRQAVNTAVPLYRTLY